MTRLVDGDGRAGGLEAGVGVAPLGLRGPVEVRSILNMVGDDGRMVAMPARAKRTRVGLRTLWRVNESCDE